MTDHEGYAQAMVEVAGTEPVMERSTFASRIRDHLVVEIAQGRLTMGAPLRELQLAKQFGTSQAPVREALRELVALGLLVKKPHSGTWVRDVGEQELADAVPVRSALESLAGRLAATRMNDVRRLREVLDAMTVAAAAGDRLAMARESTAFHRAIVIGSGNESLIRSWNSLGIEVMTIVAMLALEDPLEDAAIDHEPIVLAIEAGDADLTASLLADHIDHYIPVIAASAAADGDGDEQASDESAPSSDDAD